MGWISCQCHSFADIDWYTDKDGKLHCFRCCPECGTRTIDPLNVRTWQVRLETIIEKLAAIWEIPGNILPVVPNVLWKLGNKGGLAVFYLRRFWDDEKRVFLAELARFSNAVVVCSCNFTCEFLVQEYSGQCVALGNIAALDERGDLVLDKPSFADYFDCSSESASKPKEKSKSVSKQQNKPRRAARAVSIENSPKRWSSTSVRPNRTPRQRRTVGVSNFCHVRLKKNWPNERD